MFEVEIEKRKENRKPNPDPNPPQPRRERKKTRPMKPNQPSPTPLFPVARPAHLAQLTLPARPTGSRSARDARRPSVRPSPSPRAAAQRLTPAPRPLSLRTRTHTSAPAVERSPGLRVSLTKRPHLPARPAADQLGPHGSFIPSAAQQPRDLRRSPRRPSKPRRARLGWLPPYK